MMMLVCVIFIICFGLLPTDARHFETAQNVHSSTNNEAHTNEPPLFPVIHMDINSLKPLPAFDEPIDHIRKRISKHNRNQHVSAPVQQPQQHAKNNGAPMVKSNTVPLKQQHSSSPVMAQPPKHAARPANIRPPAAIKPAPPQQFIPHHPIVQTQNNPPVMQQMGSRIPLPNHVNVLQNRPVTRVPQIPQGPVFHPPMVLTPAMSGKNRVNPSLVIQTPHQPQTIPNQHSLINVPSIPMTLNRLPLNQVQVQNQQMPVMRMNSIPNQPLIMYQTPMLVNTIPQNVQMIQGPFANGQTLRGPLNFQIPTLQNNQISLPRLLQTNGILNQIPSVQKQPIPAAAPKPNILVTKTATMNQANQMQPSAVAKPVANVTEPKAPQLVVHQSGNSFKAPNILVKNTVKSTNKAATPQKDQKPKASSNIDLSAALTKNTALTSINQNLMKMVLDKLKHTTLNMLKERHNKMNSGAIQTNGIQKKVASTDARISNSPIQLMNNAASNLGVLSGFPASLDPKRVSVSFNPTGSKGQTVPKPPAATNAPRTIEILHKNLNRTMPNNMTLEPFTATTQKKNGKMSIMLTSKHTGNRPIVIEAATGNILVSHVKGPDGSAQFVIQHARETTTMSQTSSTTSTTPPPVTEEVEIEAEDIITTTTSTTSTTFPTTTSTGFNSVTTTVSTNHMAG